MGTGLMSPLDAFDSGSDVVEGHHGGIARNGCSQTIRYGGDLCLNRFQPISQFGNRRCDSVELLGSQKILQASSRMPPETRWITMQCSSLLTEEVKTPC